MPKQKEKPIFKSKIDEFKMPIVPPGIFSGLWVIFGSVCLYRALDNRFIIEAKIWFLIFLLTFVADVIYYNLHTASDTLKVFRRSGHLVMELRRGKRLDSYLIDKAQYWWSHSGTVEFLYVYIISKDGREIFLSEPMSDFGAPPKGWEYRKFNLDEIDIKVDTFKLDKLVKVINTKILKIEQNAGQKPKSKGDNKHQSPRIPRLGSDDQS